jgi:hypothetical protein
MKSGSYIGSKVNVSYHISHAQQLHMLDLRQQVTPEIIGGIQWRVHTEGMQSPIRTFGEFIELHVHRTLRDVDDSACITMSVINVDQGLDFIGGSINNAFMRFRHTIVGLNHISADPYAAFQGHLLWLLAELLDV